MSPPTTAVDPKLSVVVIAYNMAREIPRTLLSLSPSMQHGIAPDDYEIILIDNGSTSPFDEAALHTILPNLRIYHLSGTGPSPVRAINHGLSLARGRLVGVMIDGARMASPGLLGLALQASRLHDRPVIGTLAFHLGDEVQMASVQKGYNQAREDALLATVDWQSDGYRLFDISVFAGSSKAGWFVTPTETNALFLTAEHWRALGGYDEDFVTSGGGLANLDMWKRACEDPSGKVIMLLGEATFHQVHGGIATNSPAPPHDLFRAEYIRLRGKPFKGPRPDPWYFGSLPPPTTPSLCMSIASLPTGNLPPR